jgi:hypothetical protein
MVRCSLANATKLSGSRSRPHFHESAPDYHRPCGLRPAATTPPHQLTEQNRKFSLFLIPLFSVGTKYLDSCTACGRIIEVSKQQAEAAARQVGPDLR